jgi:hypothetical protein
MLIDFMLTPEQRRLRVDGEPLRDVLLEVGRPSTLGAGHVLVRLAVEGSGDGLRVRPSPP